MSDSQGTPPLVGQYAAPSPSLDPSYFSSVEAIDSAVNDIVFNSDGSQASLSRSTSAEAWYTLEGNVNVATEALAAINDRFAKEIKALRDALEGDTGDGFTKYATAILNTSEDVYKTLAEKQFGRAMGNIGHASQIFADGYWRIHEAADETRQNLLNSLTTNAENQVGQAESVAQVSQIQAQYDLDVKAMYEKMDIALLKDLQNALGALGTQYNDRGAELVPLYISDGNTATAAPLAQPNEPKRVMRSVGPQQTGSAGQNQAQPNLPAEQYKPDTVVSGEGAQPNLPAEQYKPDTVVPGEGAQPNLPASQYGPTTAIPTEGTQPNLPKEKYEPDTVAQPNLPKEKFEPGSLDSAGGATQSTQSPGPTNPGVSPEAQQALSDAKNAAGAAIDGLTDPDGASGGGESSGGAGGPLGAGLNPALADAKNAAGKAIDGLSSGADDPERSKALKDAKQAADDAIDGLTDPSAAPGQLTGGPEQAKLEEAKQSAAKAIDDLAKPGDSQARQEGLDSAKQAAMDAIDGLGTQDPTAPGAGDPTGADQNPNREVLMDAKNAAEKAIDSLLKDCDDPERKEALQDAKVAVSDAISKTAAPEHFQRVEDARNAADNAIDGLRGAGDDAGRQQALDEARATADKAIGQINDAAGLDGPQHDQALNQAKESADKALDALSQPGDSPAERQALADAKEAVHKAIGEIGGGGEDDAMRQFLEPGKGSFEPPRGGIGGGAGGGPAGTGDIGLTSADPSAGGAGAGGASGGGAGAGGGAAGGQSPARFDTQPLQSAPAAASAQSGPGMSPGAAPGGAGAQGGMPMSPMGMGGMGGGGQQDNKEREPQIWMQAEEGAWGDGDDAASQNQVLGRT
ncbi:hypothetical protein GCM10027598_58500 [Amycolatopsis oliviviridis]|uniref:Uncharacterized protein n=1 Tax=Amycolatopsis oliviviridis TaxID=1471590 RepID=A0ABQ3LWZ4_9PSEU|nr:large repetitive protein [Amycolatopsis oliviviridis]GHH28381.1 hypothetical protein GCM10017790_59140 [Amycolatopsis oliviviridis]